MFKSAIVGSGNIGRGHAKAYKDCTEIELVAVVDDHHKCATTLGEEAGVPCYTEVSAVMDDPEIDFIDVCTPSGHHGDVALMAAEAGKHCVCEKPLDVTPQRCDEMIAAFEKSGTLLGGIYQHRYHDDTRKLKAAVDAGRLGRLALLTCCTPWWRSQEYYDSGEWRGTWKLDGGGALMNQAIHAIDLMLWFGGPVKTVQAYTAMLAHERIEVEDVAVAVVRFESGALGVVEGTTAAYPGSGVLHKVMGDGGMAYLKSDKIDLWKLRDEEGDQDEKTAAAAETEVASSDPTVLHENLFSRNLDDIARAARTGGRPCVTGAEARRAVDLICAIYASARDNVEIEMPLEEFHP